MTPSTVFYSPAGSGMRVRILETPTRSGDDLFCAAVFEGGPKHSPLHLASRLIKQLRSPPFKVVNATLDHNIIYAPWPDKEVLCNALQSLLSHPTKTSSDASLRQQIDRNTMASLVGCGGGMLAHLVGPRRRKWRFAQFTLVEEFRLLSFTWIAIDESVRANGQQPAQIVIKGRLNSLQERALMAERLERGAGLLLS